MTHSTLASLLITLLFWFFVFMLNFTDGSLVTFKAAAEKRQAQQQSAIDGSQALIDQQRALPTTQQASGMIKNYEFQRDQMIRRKAESDPTVAQMRFWSKLVTATKIPLPKTAETVALMNRWLVDPDPLTRAGEERHERRKQRQIEHGRGPAFSDPQGTAMLNPEDPAVQESIREEFNARSAARIIGSSLVFEAVVLAVAAWIFCRRDF